jgi:hypothetical protein
MPITINGIPLVVAGQVNRQAIGAVVHGSHQTYYGLHPQALAAAVARDSPSLAQADVASPCRPVPA